MRMVHVDRVHVLALAKTRKEALSVLESLEETLKHHLFKVILFPKSVEIKHYVKEIQSYLRKFELVKLKKGYLDFDTIYNVLYDDFSSDMQGQLRDYALELKEDGYPVLKEQLDEDYSLSIDRLEQFYRDLSSRLERKYQGHHVDIIAESMLKDSGLL